MFYIEEFERISEYKDSADYITYLTVVENAFDGEYNDIFGMEEDLKSLPDDFEPAKELIGFIERNKQYKDKNTYYRPGGESAYRYYYNAKGEKISYEFQAKLYASLGMNEEDELVVDLFWDDERTTLPLSASITGKHISDIKSSDDTCEIKGDTMNQTSKKRVRLCH